MSIEPVGVAIGIVTLFSTCMQCFECVQYGKKFGDSMQEYKLKLALAKLSLQRWADSIGMDLNMTGEEAPRDTPLASLSIEEGTAVRTLLGQIQNAFLEVEQLSKKYEAKHPDPADLKVIGPIDDLSTDLGKLALNARARSQKCQKSANPLQKTRYAIFERPKFTRLITTIAEHIEALLRVFPESVMVRYMELAKEDVTELAGQDKAKLQLLKDKAVEQDEILGEAAEQALFTIGANKYDNVQVHGNAQVWFGSDVAHGVRKDGDTYSNMVIDGNTRVHAGSIYHGSEGSAAPANNGLPPVMLQNLQLMQFGRFQNMAISTGDEQHSQIRTLTYNDRAETIDD